LKKMAEENDESAIEFDKGEEEVAEYFGGGPE
jgi:hypothetical protein